MKKLLTLREVAEYFRVSEKTIRRRVKEKQLTAIRLGGPRSALRFDPDDIARAGRPRQGGPQPDQTNANSTKEQKPLPGRPPQWLTDTTDNSGVKR